MTLRYVDPKFEKADRSEIRAYQLKQLQAIVADAWDNNAFYREFWTKKGAKRKPIESLEEFSSSIPLGRKADLIADQNASPPYGKRLSCVAEGKRPIVLFHTSGTSGQGVELHATTMEDRQRAYSVSRYLYRWSGLEPGDTLFLCYPITLFAGGRVELYGLEDYGLSVFPVGNYDVRRKVELIDKFKPKSIMATTSYLGHLAAICAEHGVRHKPKVLFGGGEGGSYSWFEGQQALWGAPIFNHYGSSQTRVDHMYPCERGLGTRAKPGLLHNIDPGFFVEVIDPATGKHVKDGERGEIVITSLIHKDIPFIRHAMGDAAVYHDHTYCDCGRPFAGVEVGTIGRLDDMKKIKGVNVWPQAVDEAVFVNSGVDEYQVVLTRDRNAADVATVYVMPKPEMPQHAVSELSGKIKDELRKRIGLSFQVEMTGVGKIAFSEYKARRWVDKRDVGDVQAKPVGEVGARAAHGS